MSDAKSNLTHPSLATITGIYDLATNIKLVQLKLDDPEVRKSFTYSPGQFAEVSVF